MDKRTSDPSWCRSLRDDSVRQERKDRTKRTSEERLDDWHWSDETNLCEQLKPANIEIRYLDTIGRVTNRLVTVESVIEKGGGVYLKVWCHTKNAERTFRIDGIREITDADTGNVFCDVESWVAAAIRL